MKILKNIAISEAGFLFNPGTGESFSVNPLGIEIIKGLQANKGLDEIKAEVLENYQTDEATFEKDMADFIGILQHNSLIDTNGEKAN
jgi:hypothetical protein